MSNYAIGAAVLEEHPEWGYLTAHGPVRAATEAEATRYAVRRRHPDWQDVYKYAPDTAEPAPLPLPRRIPGASQRAARNGGNGGWFS